MARLPGCLEHHMDVHLAGMDRLLVSHIHLGYKILTAILQKRISDALDKHLQRTQYGFRKAKGTAQAIHYVRRIIEKGEKTRTKRSEKSHVLSCRETPYVKDCHQLLQRL